MRVLKCDNIETNKHGDLLITFRLQSKHQLLVLFLNKPNFHVFGFFKELMAQIN
jgi:hypothetical protein